MTRTPESRSVRAQNRGLRKSDGTSRTPPRPRSTAGPPTTAHVRLFTLLLAMSFPWETSAGAFATWGPAPRAACRARRIAAAAAPPPPPPLVMALPPPRAPPSAPGAARRRRPPDPCSPSAQPNNIRRQRARGGRPAPAHVAADRDRYLGAGHQVPRRRHARGGHALLVRHPGHVQGAPADRDMREAGRAGEGRKAGEREAERGRERRGV